MNQYDRQTVERIIEEVTREVVLRLNQAQNGAPACDCSTGGAACADCVNKMAAAGADRVSGRLGNKSYQSDVARLIDHTLLKADASQDEIAQLCYEAKTYNFASVCVNPAHVKLSAQLLKGSAVKVCTVIGFPLGASAATTKGFEAGQALRDGATELDMVINVGALKSQDYDAVLEDIATVVSVGHASNALVKTILETALLTDEEKVIACQLARVAGADFVKTSTGFGPGGATVEDVRLMRQVVGPDIGVKASGGVRTYEDAQAMVAAGATRLGASAGVRIVSGQSAGAVSKSTY